MKFSNNDILLLGAVVIGGIIILNTATDDVNSTVTNTGNTVAQLAPWGIGAIVAWGLILA